MSQKRIFTAIATIAGCGSKMKQVAPVGALLCLLTATAPAADQEFYILQQPGLNIRFEPPLLSTATAL